MKVLISCDAYKDSLTALAACKAIERGIHFRNQDVETHIFPMADGGEGTLDVLKAHLDLESIDIEVKNPLGRPIQTFYYKTESTAFIELAQASGFIRLQAHERNPMFTSTEGTGEQIAHAIENGADRIYLFLGGSATNDAAIGIAHALGYRFLDSNQNILKPIGSNLSKIQQIKLPDASFDHVTFKILCDVKNLLFGENGAAYTYAAQKGASNEEIKLLDEGLQNFARVVKAQLGHDISHLRGGGAAGGVSAGMVALFTGQLEPGFHCISELSGLEDAIASSDVVISGEGMLDRQTLEGKLIFGLAGLCKKYSKKLLVIVGENKLEEAAWRKIGIDQVYTIMERADDLTDAMSNAGSYIESIAKRML